MDRRFFHRLGASQLERAICSAAGEAGLESVYGVKMGTEPEQFRHSKYIIAWASNIHANNVHLWPFIAEARRNGAKLVVIDPYTHADCGLRRLVLADQSGNGCGAGAGHDARHHRRKPARCRLCFEVHAGLRATAREGEGVSAGAGRAMDGDRGRGYSQAGARVCHGTTVGDSPELWRAALGGRRDGDPHHLHAAVHHWDRGKKLAAGCRCRPAERRPSTRRL